MTSTPSARLSAVITPTQEHLVSALIETDRQLGPLRRYPWRNKRTASHSRLIAAAVDHRHLLAARLHATGIAPASIARLAGRHPNTVSEWITKGLAL